MTNLLTAAQARMAGVRQRGDRPSQRRAQEMRSDTRMGWPSVRASAVVSLREVDSDTAAPGLPLLHFHGVASVTETPYEMYDIFGPYTEVVAATAFDESLRRADLDVPLVLGHDQLRRIARTTTATLTLIAGPEGLVVDAPMLDPTDADVAYIAPKLRAGLIDEMSFAFRIDAGEWSPDWTTFRITQADIHRGDVAIVGYGANPATWGGLRSDPAAQGPAALSPDRLLPWLDAVIAATP